MPTPRTAAGIAALGFTVVVLVVTIVPASGARSANCNLDLINIARFDLSGATRLLTISLYTALGATTWLALTRDALRARVVPLLALLAIGAELAQVAPILGRTCDLIDVVDATVGAMFGVTLARFADGFGLEPSGRSES